MTRPGDRPKNSPQIAAEVLQQEWKNYLHTRWFWSMQPDLQERQGEHVSPRFWTIPATCAQHWQYHVDEERCLLPITLAGGCGTLRLGGYQNLKAPFNNKGTPDTTLCVWTCNLQIRHPNVREVFYLKKSINMREKKNDLVHTTDLNTTQSWMMALWAVFSYLTEETGIVVTSLTKYGQ